LTLTPRERMGLVCVVALVVVIRLASLGSYPLMDPTEARYGEIARKMLETGNWLMPQYDYGVPFWGKPPLSTWLSAASMAAFGVNEFAVRLPSLVLLIGCGALVWLLGALRGRHDEALWALAVFVTTGLIFVAAGAVMTDAALLLGTTLSMTGFWIAVASSGQAHRVAGFAFFVGLVVGLLAKGPIGVVLTLVPVGAWTLWTRRWRDVWVQLPWIVGTIATTALVLPWYWSAERATPGFLAYFIVGEHWKRFVESGWAGDLYGAAHARPRGTIWLFWLLAALPWSVPAVVWLGRAAVWRRGDLRALVRDPWHAYLMAWTVVPMLFFTFSGNVLPTYVLPALPAFALLVASLWHPMEGDARTLRPVVRHVLVAGTVLCLLFAGGIFWAQRRFDTELSNRALVRMYEAMRVGPNQRLVYVGTRPVSAEFYSGGRAVKVADVAALRPYLDDTTPDFIVFQARDLAALPDAVRSRLSPLGEFGNYRLLRETSG
jgi:4-amino-4-deoxy-L-arabinose transferase-like glycosyltransferase